MEHIDLIRITLAFLCGYFICLSGTLTQLISNNPLASPSTLGMDGFSVLFVIIAQLLISTMDLNIDLSQLSLRLFIFFFLLLSVIRKRRTTEVWDHFNIKTIIILGLTFNLFVGAIFTILQFLFVAFNYDFPTGLWFGSFKVFSSDAIFIFLALFLLTQVFIFKFAKHLQFLNLGRVIAQSLGVNIARVQKYSILLSLLLTGFVISYFGVFSFLGLILPHLMRQLKWFKLNMNNEVVYAPYISGVLMALLDWFCYNFTINGAELPVGMVSGILGSFLLIGLLIKSGINRA